MNALRNGSRIGSRVGKIVRLKLGKLPRTMGRQLYTAQQYRRSLEDAVVKEKGEVDLLDAHLIDEAASAELHAGISRWLLRNRIDQLKPADILKCTEQMLKAKTIRNKAVERLGLDRREVDAIEAIYAPHGAEPSTNALTCEQTTNHTSNHKESVLSDPREASTTLCDLCDSEGLSGRACPKCGVVG